MKFQVDEKQLQEMLRNGYEVDERLSVDGYYDDGNGRAIVTPDPPKPHKYRAQATVVDDIRFDSKAEAKRYKTLAALERTGVISRLELQPSFMLIDGFTDAQGNKHRAITYKADFSYYVDGERVVEDVKGMQTPVFKMKHKLLAMRYLTGTPQFSYRIVDGNGKEK